MSNKLSFIFKTHFQLLFSVFFFLIANTTFGKERKWDQTLSGNLIVSGANLSVQDYELNASNYTIETSITSLELKIDDFSGPFYWYSYTAHLQITPRLTNGTLGTPYEVKLFVENNRYGNAGNFIDLQKHLIDGRGADITVLSIAIQNKDNNTSESITPSNVILTLSYTSERYYDFNSANTPTLVFETDTQSNELFVSWNEIQEAEEYELAWTWVDNYSSSDLTSVVETTLLPLSSRNFELNCTRIQTKNLNYRIPLIYDNGYLVFRIRAIGRFWDVDFTKKLFGNWDITPSQVNSTVSSWLPNIYTTNAPINPLNWQFQASFAENGKKKEVVSYFDGSLRNRQTVTKINTSDKIVIGEVIYDEEGRPAIEVLPVPTDDKAISYYQDFNRNLNEKVYSYQDLNTTTNDPLNCGITMGGIGMSPSVKGASKYYSSNTDLENNYQDFVSDAEKFPFSQIEYTLDNTGRIKRKGGVGIQHQLGTGHEMKYFYSVPSQEELNRLFGYSVGFSSHYKKNYVIDPNNQISISYIDPQGRTIATALIADKPENLMGLEDESSTTLHQSAFEDLLNKLNPEAIDTPLDNNNTFSTGYFGNLQDGLRYDSQKVFVNEGLTSFEYNLLKKTPFIYKCGDLTYNYPFVYKLSNDIVNDCGHYYKQISPAISIGSYDLDSEESVVLVPSSEELVYTDSFILALPVGAYGFNKTLNVDGETLDLFASDYIERGIKDNCILGPINGEPNLIGCFHSCEDCITHYTTHIYTDNNNISYPAGLESFIAEMLSSDSVYLNLDEAAPGYAEALNIIRNRYINEFDQILIACNVPCQPDGYNGGENTSMNCENALNDLINDMLPTGQYGIYPTSVDTEGSIINEPFVPIEEIELTVYNDDMSVNKVYSVVDGINTTKINWRNPHYFDKDGFLETQYTTGNIVNIPNEAYKHYRTLDGQIDYVLVSWNEDNNTFSPPIVLEGVENPSPSNLTNPINIIDVDAGLYQVEPQFLLHVEDFLDELSSREHWILSLIKYHPEFHYLDYIWAQCKLSNTQTIGHVSITMNSDGLDAYIGSFNTYQEAKDAGLLNNALTLFDNDPFFINTHPKDGFVVSIPSENNGEVTSESTAVTPAISLNLKKSIMLAALNNSTYINYPYNSPPQGYENTGDIMVMYIYKTIRCNGLDFNCFPIADNTFEGVMDIVDELTEDEKNLFWSSYVSQYIGLKQKIKDVFLQMYASRQGFYNDVIGNNNSWNFNKIKEVLNKYPVQKAMINDWIQGDVPIPNLQSMNGNLLKDKVKRFLPFDETYESEQSDEYNYEQMQQNAASYYTSITGNCPIINDLAIFIDNLTKSSLLGQNPSGQDVSTTTFFSSTSTSNLTFIGGYLTPALFQALGGEGTLPISTLNVGSNHLNNQTIVIQFNQINSLSPIELTLPSTYAWGQFNNATNATSGWKILQVNSLSHTGIVGTDYLFSFVARVHNNANINLNSFVEVVITGKTPIVLTCTTDGTGGVVSINLGNGINCTKKEDFANAIRELIQGLQISGNINDLDFEITDFGPFSEGYLPNFFEFGTLTRAFWRKISSSYFIFVGDDNSNYYPRIKIDIDIPVNVISNFVISDLNVSGYSNNITIKYFDNQNEEVSVNGIINDNSAPIVFECCIPQNENNQVNLVIEDYFDISKILFNELIDFVVYHVDNDLPLPSTYTSPNVILFSNFFLQSFDELSNITYSTDGSYSISFELPYTANCPSAFGIQNSEYFGASIRINSIFNSTAPYNYTYDLSGNGNYVFSGVLGYTQALYSNGQITYSSGRNGCLKSFSQLPNCPCTPQAIPAVSCTEKYDLYVASLLNGALPRDEMSLSMTVDLFCNYNFHHILDGYMYYIQKFGITTANYNTNNNYISLGNFGASELNYGYSNYNEIIDLYFDYLNNSLQEYSYPQYTFGGNYYNEIPNPELDFQIVQTWKEFVKMYLSNSNICPPYPMTPHLTIKIPMDNPCVDFGTSVYQTYNAEAYAAYIQALKDKFKTDYLEQALRDVVEQYTLEYKDKEYQYTLYYYDQAGNLIQTVAPEGVTRLSPELNSDINTFRQDGQDVQNEEDISLLPLHDFKTQYRYNSLNQLVWQRTPDGGETRFAYDPLGRIVASQNDKQKNISPINPLKFDFEKYIEYNSTLNLYHKTVNDNVWKYSGGYSQQGFLGNGFMEHTIRINEDNPLHQSEQLVVGLSYSNFIGVNNSLHYGFYYKSNGTFVIRIGNTDLFSEYSISNGDKMKIAREGNQIKFYQNGNLLYQLNDSYPNEQLYADFGIFNYDSKIHEIRLVQVGTPKFSYTKYDALGRIFEAGEMDVLENFALLYIDDNGKLVNPAVSSNEYTDTWVGVDFTEDDYPHRISKLQHEVTRTLYDDYSPFNPDVFLTAQNIRQTRNRVTSILTYDYRTEDRPLEDFETAIFYNYDIHGNVDEMSQKLSSTIIFDENQPNGILKRVNYKYDLISGNVNEVIYQKDDKFDQFIHRYQYDADNRITSVTTSRDGYIWEKDASYLYYDHGPLAKVVLGDKKVQGIDYAYTLQGWLKTVNSENLALNSNDMGSDGNYVSKDAFGYSLSYFNNDYKARNLGNHTIHDVSTSNNGLGGISLYNGNINRMITSVRGIKEEILPSQINLYSYDQLNRIFEMRSFSSTYEDGHYSIANSYRSNYTYDRNGNLKTLHRDAPKKITSQGPEQIIGMDRFTYNYIPHTNKLTHLNDSVNASEFGNLIDSYKSKDIDNQEENNYVYDELGQLISDEAEGIINIDWRVDGKVKSILKDATETMLTFYYDGLGNRVVKKVNNGRRGGSDTHYTRDAQGNVMATYTLGLNHKNRKEYLLDEHHIYGSSRLGIQTYTFYEQPENFHRLVGDKRYELTNHLGNVINVINDRKLVENKVKVIHTNFFDEEPWDAYHYSKIGITDTRMLEVIPLEDGAGAVMKIGLNSGDNYIFQLDIIRDNIPSTSALMFAIRDDNMNILVSQEVNENGFVYQQFTAPFSGTYFVTVTQNTVVNPASFYLDNYYVYALPASGQDFVSLYLPDVLAYNDYYPFGMQVPRRFDSLEDYRYGFQGQEKDDEVKGEGNSLNYTFRMHDARVGRFFARDPLELEYAWNSPYAFSANRVIASIELEGLEDTAFTRMLDKKLGSKAWLQMSTEQRRKEANEQAVAMTIGVAVAVDIRFNQGRGTKFLAKQFGTQLAVNTTVSAIFWFLPGDNKFEPSKIIEEAFTGFDLADAGIDKGMQIIIDKYKIGKIQKAIKAIAPSLFDITIKDGVQIVGINKEADKIITDLVGNILVDKLENKLETLPTAKLSSSSQAQVLGQVIMDEIKQTLTKNNSNKTLNINEAKIKEKVDYMDEREVKNDAIPKSR